MTNFKVFSLVAFLFISILSVYGQENLSIPNAKRMVTVPFTMLTGGVIMVKGLLNNYPDSLNFIIDTGSGGISLDSLTCLRLGIPLVPSSYLIRGVGGVREVKFLYNASLKLDTLTTDSLNFHVNDYDILSSVYGTKIDGIIGFSYIKKFILRIDYDSMYMEIFSKGRFQYPKNGFLMHPNMQSIPVVDIKFRESKKLRNSFFFDTGAGLCLMLSEEYVKDSAVFSPLKRPPVLTQAEGLGGKMIMKLTTVKALHVGPYTFKNVPTHIFEDVYNITAYPILGGLIGNDILRRFNMVLNYAKKEIHLTPNSSFKDAFDYAYTGLGLYDNSGSIIIEDIIPDSPGDKAGFLPGDRIVGINNNFSNDIRQYKTILQSVTQKIKFLISRDGELLEIKMKPINIMR